MKIYTSYFARAKELFKRGVLPVAIARFPPKLFTGPVLAELQPDADGLMDFKRGLRGAQAAREDYARLLAGLCAWDVVRRLEKLGGGKDVALCCYERPRDFCHRRLVRAWLGRNGVPCAEYDFRPPNQLDLFEEP